MSCSRVREHFSGPRWLRESGHLSIAPRASCLSGTATGTLPVTWRSRPARRYTVNQPASSEVLRFKEMETTDAGTPTPGSLDELVPTLYSELRRLARLYLRNERRNHTLQPTALVHEAYLKLLQQHKVDWHNEAQVLGLAAHLMRRVLASYAERRNAQKRAGRLQQVTLSLVQGAADQSEIDFFEVDGLIEKLAALDERQGKVAELRLFGGLNSPQIAEVLSVSTATVERDWASARLWFARELRRGAER